MLLAIGITLGLGLVVAFTLAALAVRNIDLTEWL